MAVGGGDKLYRKIVTLKSIPTVAVKAFVTDINNECFHFS